MHWDMPLWELVEWFNTRRLLELGGNITPSETEPRFYAVLDNQTWPEN